MKGNHLFIICIAIFLLLMFAIECRLPKKFVWAPSFSHYDKQPFGCAVFDSLLSTSLPKGYSLSRKTFYELEQEDTISRRGILVATNNLSLTDVDVEAILKIAKRGNKIMLVSNSFNRNLEDTLDFNSSYSYFSPALLKKYAAASLEKDTLLWVGILPYIPGNPLISILNCVLLTSCPTRFRLRYWQKRPFRLII